MKNTWIPLGAACVLVIVVYLCHPQWSERPLVGAKASEAYYNLLVQGFRAGQLNLKKDVPPGLTQLADPYDPTANLPYRSAPYSLHDLSYFNGKLYLYWGITPALSLFWPYVGLTGHYLDDRQAVKIFCIIGFLAGAVLLYGLWRRYFPEVGAVVVAMCALGLGLATGVLVLLARPEVYEVSISCGYMLTMLALAAIWRAWHEPEPRRRWGWLAGASLAYGLAVGARPSLLFGGVILLGPVVAAWRQRRPVWAMAMAAIGPIALITLCLMIYNSRRFGSPFEFGMRYQLAATRQMTHRLFDLRYLWFNFRMYFLEPAQWGREFPFAYEIAVPPLPPGHDGVEGAFGVLPNIPLVWLALAAPLSWRKRSGEAETTLRGFVTVVAVLLAICALSLCLFRGVVLRYEVEFLPAAVLLAVVGILGLERALVDRPAWRRVARLGWGLLLGFSVLFNLLACENAVEPHYYPGTVLRQRGNAP